MSADPSDWGVALHTAWINGITMRYADTALTEADKSKPVILMMHGWPESWFSWRHQLKVMSRAGFRGLAPDMRGYGGTDAPEDPAAYVCYTLAADMLALLQHVGVTSACLVGHDHGANTGWALSLLHPTVFTCYFAMSVPYNMRRSEGPAPIEGMRQRFGDERQPETNPGFFYILHHQLAAASDQYGENTREVLTMLYGDKRAAGTLPPAVLSDRLYVDGEARGMWARSERPGALSTWISQAELDCEYCCGHI
eukprot:SAG25_NODE_26_length_21086_cov_21.643065_7_plen_253_part_00